MSGLIANLQAATGPSRMMDHAIAAALGVTTVTPHFYTSSIDAALTLVPEGYFYFLGKGRLEPDEPLYGAQIIAMGAHDRPIGTGEHDISLALALCIAALAAHDVLHPQPAPQGTAP